MKRSIRIFSIATLVLGTITAALVFACETPIAPAYILDQPRILAIRATPIDLAPNGQVTLDALVYTPAGSPTPTYSWSWCAGVGSTLQCTTTAAALTTVLDPTGEAGVSIDYALGSNATATFTYPVDPAVIQTACGRPVDDDAGDGGDASDDDGGDAGDDAGDADVSPPFAIDRDAGLVCASDAWTIYVLLTVTVGDKTLQAARQLTIDLDAPTSANTNPTIVGLAPFTTSIAADSGPFADPGDQADGAVIDAGVGSVTSGSITIAAIVPLAATDLYAGRVAVDDSGVDLDASADDAGDSGAQVFESLDFAWFVESGQLGAATTTLRAVAQGSPQDWNAAHVNHWVAAQSGTAQMIVVVRDDRGGVGWIVVPAKAP